MVMFSYLIKRLIFSILIIDQNSKPLGAGIVYAFPVESQKRLKTGGFK